MIYPGITTWVVVATGNHYWLDGVAGAALLCVALAAVHRLPPAPAHRRGPGRRRRGGQAELRRQPGRLGADPVGRDPAARAQPPDRRRERRLRQPHGSGLDRLAPAGADPLDVERTAGAVPYANRLDRDLAQLTRAVAGLVITAPVMAAGIARQVEEAISEKLPGTEDRWARTDLADLAANIEGARAGYGFARPVLAARDPDRAALVDRQFAAVDRTIGRYRIGSAYRAYPALSATDKGTLQAQLTTLAEHLADIPSTLR